MSNFSKNRLDPASLGFQAASADELQLVVGGGIWGAIKRAAIWVKDHIYVDTKNNAAGVKGRF